MGSKLLAHLRRQWMGALALFLVLTGGVAYAANTVSSSDIVNDQVYSADVRNDTLTGGGLAAVDLRSGSVGTAEIAGGGVRSDDVQNESLSGNDVQNQSLSGVDIHTESLTGANILDGQLSGAEIGNGSLQDVDVAEGTFNFTANIGNVAANACTEVEVSGVNAQGDHLLLTPNANSKSPILIYSAEYADTSGSMLIQVCNPTGSAINDGTTRFNLLVIDAQ